MKPLLNSKRLTSLAFVLALLPAPSALAEMRVVVAEDGTIQFIQVGADAVSTAEAALAPLPMDAAGSGIAAALAPAYSAAASPSALASAVTVPDVSGSAQADPGEAAAAEAEPGDDGFVEILPSPPVIVPPEKAEDPIAAQFNACEKISFDDTVLFDIAKHDLKPHAGPAFDAVAKVLLAHPSIQVRIEGHTDSRGGVQYNQALSERRANAVYQALLQRGVPAQQMEVAGYGITRPEATNDTAVGRAMNRRVDLVPLNC